MFEWVKIGARVICINVDIGLIHHLYPEVKSWEGTLNGLTKGKIYTIRNVYTGKKEELLINLYEIIRPVEKEGIETGFYIHRFRPLVTKTIKEDLSIFTPFLDTKLLSNENFVVTCDRRIE